MFEDDRFPAGGKSLGYEELGPYSFKSREVVWKRPKVKIFKFWGGNVPLTGMKHLTIVQNIF